MTRITFGMQLRPLRSCSRMVNTILWLEEMGFDQVTMPDHILYTESVTSPDAWSLLAAAAHGTSRIQLGTCVTDPHRHPPAVLAHRLATLDRMSKGRIFLGLGAGEKMNLGPFGMEVSKPVGHLKESVRIIRHLLDSDEPLDFDGEFFKLRGAKLQIRPVQKRVPIGLAALGPVMQKFAGEMVDSWLPLPLPADLFGELYAPIEAAAAAAGRSGAVRPCAHVVVVASTNREEVLRVARGLGLFIVHAGTLERLGVTLDLPPEVAATNYMTVNPLDEDSMRRYRAHCDAIPDEVLLQTVVWGNTRKIRQQLGNYVDAGASHFIMSNFSPSYVASTIMLATLVLPYFTRRAPTTQARMARVLSARSRAGATLTRG